MPEADDITLLREYADGNSESAFAVIVRRHIDLVYSVALRYVGNSPDAQDVTQAVFIVLAQKASSLRQRAALTGWLYETTRFTAMNFLTAKTRRQAREQKAYMHSTLDDANSENIWGQLAPLLEEAMTQLSEKERTLVALRFFENKSGAETAAVLGIQEWAAHKRAARAMEKLRKFFAKRGIASTTVTLAAVISAHSVQAAPAMLAKAVTATALAKGATASTSTLTLFKGALKIMAWSKTKTLLIAGLAVLLAAGTTTVTVSEIKAHQSQAWRKRFDTADLDRVPRQATILPALRSRPAEVKGWRRYHGMYMGLNQDVAAIASMAYGVNRARVIFSTAAPEGSYDYISNFPKNQNEALQQAIKKEFGLAGRREMIETNVLFLTVRNPNAAGLKRTATGDVQLSNANGFIVRSNYPVASLVPLFENYQDSPVVNRTGFTGYFDLKCDAKNDTAEGLKQAVLDELGLELVPGKDRVEFLVMEKAN